jgi:hypothetical protein
MESMNLPQIWKFVDESLTSNKEWSRIDIIGGEPTLYDELHQMWKFIKLYKDRHPKCHIRFSTNGIDAAKKIMSTYPTWVYIRDSSKEECNKSQLFEAINSAPIDNGETETRSCSIPWRCGIGLTRYGYFLCGAGASIARVFGYDIGIKYLAEVTPEDILHQANTLCRVCGHSNVKSKHVTRESDISPSWREALRKYNVEKPRMSTY